MKRISAAVSIMMILGLLSATAWGKGTPGVKNTIHNLSTSAPGFSFYVSDNVDEICVFCHTPHGGDLTGPLWNHDLPAANTFTHYNSATISPYLDGLSVSRDVNDESLLCMACHDGSVAVDHLINDPNVLNGAAPTVFGGNIDVEIIDLFGGVGGRIGASLANTTGTGDLSDDHPISFSYSSVLADPVYAGGSKTGELRPIGNTGDTTSALGWKGEGVRFFGTDNRVECSSCHDPHVDYVSGVNNPKDYGPFLIRPNSGSDLCLACHNK